MRVCEGAGRCAISCAVLHSGDTPLERFHADFRAQPQQWEVLGTPVTDVCLLPVQVGACLENTDGPGSSRRQRSEIVLQQRFTGLCLS